MSHAPTNTKQYSHACEYYIVYTTKAPNIVTVLLVTVYAYIQEGQRGAIYDQACSTFKILCVLRMGGPTKLAGALRVHTYVQAHKDMWISLAVDWWARKPHRDPQMPTCRCPQRQIGKE